MSSQLPAAKNPTKNRAAVMSLRLLLFCQGFSLYVGGLLEKTSMYFHFIVNSTVSKEHCLHKMVLLPRVKQSYRILTIFKHCTAHNDQQKFA